MDRVFSFCQEIAGMKTIYLMRHGETLLNTMELNQRQCDSPLTQTGIAQAKNAKKWFETQEIHFDAVYSSTAEIVTGGMPYTRRKG